VKGLNSSANILIRNQFQVRLRIIGPQPASIWYHLFLQVSREWKAVCNKNVTVLGSCKGDLLAAPWLKAFWWLLSSQSDQHTVGGISSLGKIYFFHFLWKTWWHGFCVFNGTQRAHSASTALIHLLFSFLYCFSQVYRIFGNLNFVTDLGVWGALSPNIASVFVHLVRISRYRLFCSL